MSSLCGPLMFGKRSLSSATISAVSSIDSVVCVTKAMLSGFFGTMVLASSAVSIRVTAPTGSWPSVPTTSGWWEWPIRKISRPRLKWIAASRCTLVTSGQVASSENRLREVASAGTDFGTPWAENTTGAVVFSGISASSSTKIAPFFFNPSTTYLLCTISWRT
ncbi:hypothetical protein ACVWXN_009464 [Bradyrhizobium sp. i1.4.4]